MEDNEDLKGRFVWRAQIKAYKEADFIFALQEDAETYVKLWMLTEAQKYNLPNLLESIKIKTIYDVRGEFFTKMGWWFEVEKWPIL